MQTAENAELAEKTIALRSQRARRLSAPSQCRAGRQDIGNAPTSADPRSNRIESRLRPFAFGTIESRVRTIGLHCPKDDGIVVVSDRLLEACHGARPGADDS